MIRARISQPLPWVRASLSGAVPPLSLPCHQQRPFSSGSSQTAPVDYYKVLGITPSASLDDIKRTFREQAKKYHPDLAKGPSEADSLAAFKLVNEAYSVLSDASERREYDRRHAAQARGRGTSLRVKNEGEYGGVPPVESTDAGRPDSSYPGDVERRNEVFRDAMVRATEKQKEGARARAALARLQRPKVEVTGGTTSWGFVFPALVAGLWAVNFVISGGK